MSESNSTGGAAPPQLSIVPPSPEQQMRPLQVDEAPGAGAHYAHYTGPEDAVGDLAISGRIIIASCLLPWELSFGKDSEWVSL